MSADTDWLEIRRLHQAEGVPKRELARRFGRDVKTIRRILGHDGPPGQRRARPRGRRLDPFREEILGWLRQDEGLTARQVTDRLGARAGTITERTVRKYLALLREDVESQGNGGPAGDGSPEAAPPAPPEPSVPDVEPIAELDDDTTGEVPVFPPLPAAAPEPEPEPLPEVSTPSDSVPPPEPDEAGGFDLASSRCYLNRETTWLNFNFRVLNEAADERTPLIERVKFIAIVGGNVDEFFMKRIGGLKQQVGAGMHDRTVDGRTPQEQIAECCALVRTLETAKRELLLRVIPELEEHGIVLTSYSDLAPEDKQYLRKYYLENIFPLVTPQATDPAHPFPFISNLSLNLLVNLRYPKDPASSLARVKVPLGGGIPRLLELPDGKRFVRMESVMAENLDLLFPGMEIEHCSVFRVTRNANTEMEEDKADDLLAMIESELRERKFAPVVRLEVAKNMLPHYRGMLAAELGLDEEEDVFEAEGMLGMSDLWELVGLPRLQELEDSELFDTPHHPAEHPDLKTDRNIFHTLRDVGSVLLHHPYQSFPNTVERFVREAATDPKVRAIKMTLYRTSATSRAIQYLIEAARNGKQVAVVVELKARFDEAAIMRWANRMEEVGIHVTYGVVGLKTHCKVILVVRQDFNGLRRYAHVGTGNYHADTARLYSDVGMLTADPQIGRDLTELFNYLTTGLKPKRRYDKLLPAPKHCKQALLRKIRREVELHSAESPGHIQFKTNALEDADVTRALYGASQAGVRVDLLIRDTCRLRPGIPGLSENVRVIGVVGRFLEHARIYYFRNGGDEEYYIGSADCMKRNLASRVEFICPVEAPELQEELRFFLDTQTSDRRSAWEMRPDGSYVQRRPRARTEAVSCQERMIRWADERARQASRLRRRKPRGISRRNVR